MLVCASAVGYYGDTGDRSCDEDAPSGSSFLAEVCRQWEAAADPAREAGVRVVHLRTGLVLAGDGGPAEAAQAARSSSGSRASSAAGGSTCPGSRCATRSRAIQFLLEHDLAGPVNLTGPAPVTNAEFMTVIGRVLHRPTVLPAPGFGVRLVLGEFAGEVLGGQRAVPAALSAAGFDFDDRDVESALRWALDR